MHIFILVIFFTISLNANSLETLVQKSINQHNSLDAIKYRLSSMNQKIDISTLFDNPQLSLDISDIDLSRPFDRGIEPMQYQAIGFKQKFPWFGKLEAKKGVSLARRAILLDSYNEARVELALQVRLAYYSIVSIKKQIYILKKI